VLGRRSFLFGCAAAARAQSPALNFRLEDITAAAGLRFTHNPGGAGRKWLPETLGPGCAFIDYDNDGWQDILLVNGMDLAPPRRSRSTLRLYRNNRDGSFTDVTRAAGLDIEMYGLGAAVGDFDNDGFPDIFISCLGQSRLFRNNGRGGFADVTAQAGLAGREGFSTSAMWLDYDRDGLLDLFVCNYVRWSPAADVWCSLDGKTKSYCTPEAYRGATCWLFRNRGGGVFEDVTAKAGLFDASSKTLGAALIDYDQDGWPDIVTANDTQPNKLYRNNRDGTFTETGVKSGLAFSEDGKARAGMGVDAAEFDDSGRPGVAITNFDNEMLGLYRAGPDGVFHDSAPRSAVGAQTRRSLGFGCFFYDADLDGRLDLLVANGHIDESVARVRRGVSHAQPPHLFLNDGRGGFRDVAPAAGAAFAAPKVARGAAHGVIDAGFAPAVLLTTNGGPAYLYRTVLDAPHRAVRLTLKGTQSNRSAIGATVRFEAGDLRGARTVHSGSSYLSQSELPLTLGLGRRPQVDRAVIAWPSGRIEEYKGWKAGARIEIVEGRGAAVKS
jgi:hypothetical protein